MKDQPMLRNKIIRLAHQRPDLRPHLLPLLAKTSAGAREHYREVMQRGRMPSIDMSKYPKIPGMEGPFRYPNGRILYYDPREGAYYDRRQDLYLSNREAEHIMLRAAAGEDAEKQRHDSPTMRQFVTEASSLVGGLLANAPLDQGAREFLGDSIRWLRWGIPSPGRSKFLLGLSLRHEDSLSPPPSRQLRNALYIRGRLEEAQRGKRIVHDHVSQLERDGKPVPQMFDFLLRYKSARGKLTHAQKRLMLRMMDSSRAIKSMGDLAATMNYLQMGLPGGRRG
jgi:hypothetical protein